MDSNSVSILMAMNLEVVTILTRVLPSVIYGIATTFASIVAIYTIRSWRREFKGKRQIELAEDVLALFYQARDVIIAIRSPLGYGGEGSTREPAENETKEQKKARDNAYVVVERYNKRQEVFNKLLSMRYRFMAQVGKDKAEPFVEIRKVVNKIFVSARMLAELWAPRRWQHYDEKRQEELFAQREKYEAIFWEGDPEKDEITKRVDKAVSEIEQICKNIIMGKSAKK